MRDDQKHQRYQRYDGTDPVSLCAQIINVGAVLYGWPEKAFEAVLAGWGGVGKVQSFHGVGLELTSKSESSENRCELCVVSPVKDFAHVSPCVLNSRRKTAGFLLPTAIMKLIFSSSPACLHDPGISSSKYLHRGLCEA